MLIKNKAEKEFRGNQNRRARVKKKTCAQKNTSHNTPSTTFCEVDLW